MHCNCAEGLHFTAFHLIIAQIFMFHIFSSLLQQFVVNKSVIVNIPCVHTCMHVYIQYVHSFALNIHSLLVECLKLQQPPSTCYLPLPSCCQCFFPAYIHWNAYTIQVHDIHSLLSLVVDSLVPRLFSGRAWVRG